MKNALYEYIRIHITDLYWRITNPSLYLCHFLQSYGAIELISLVSGKMNVSVPIHHDKVRLLKVKCKLSGTLENQKRGKSIIQLMKTKSENVL